MMTGTNQSGFDDIVSKTTRLASDGKVTIPHDIRKRLGLKPGDKGSFDLHQDGTLTLRFERDRSGKPWSA